MPPSEYHAVALMTGQALYAKGEPAENGFIRLTEVFYIVSQQAEESRTPKGALLRRGRELHGPSQMLVNLRHVLFIEPVAADSRIGVLIKEEEARGK